jgi:hypothetical protein
MVQEYRQWQNVFHYTHHILICTYIHEFIIWTSWCILLSRTLYVQDSEEIYWDFIVEQGKYMFVKSYALAISGPYFLYYYNETLRYIFESDN